MKSSTIRRIIAVSAMTAAIPLAALGVKNLVYFRPGKKQSQQLVFSREGDKEIIHVGSGDGALIQEALRALPEKGGRVVLSAGTYLINVPIVMDRNDQELVGDQERTVLLLAPRANIPLLVIGSMDTPVKHRVSGVQVRKLTLDGNRQQQDSECNGGPCDAGGLSFIRNNALTIRGAEDTRIEHVTARRARSGGVVLEKVCRRIHISDFTSLDNHFDGFAAYETEESFFTRMFLHENRSAGISADIRFNRNIISHTRLENNGSQGIFMRDSNFNNFSRLTINKSGAQGVFIAQADDAVNTPCTGNLFSDISVSFSKGVGFRVNDVSCVANMLANSHFTANAEGAVSEAAEKLLTQTNVVIHVPEPTVIPNPAAITTTAAAEPVH